jgi:2-polyprenyl-3-methyl-5-hydroxy-6-metoxy-1,4-benzoquinol methylase
MSTGATGKWTESESAALKARVRDYWNVKVEDWEITAHKSGSREYFAEIEAYRFEKLSYLPKTVQFDGYAGKTVLDVGCGLGNDLSRFVRGGSIVTGIDLSPRAIELARMNFAQRGLPGRFEVMDGEALGLPDESFDVVYCHTVLHFTPDPDQMVREIHRVLKRDGIAIIMIANRRSWMNVLRRVMNIKIDHLDSPVFRHRTIAEFRELLAPFASVELVVERFPVATRVHGGIQAWLYNALFVGAFNILPKSWTRRTGHHLLAFCRKCAGS